MILWFFINFATKLQVTPSRVPVIYSKKITHVFSIFDHKKAQCDFHTYNSEILLY